MKREILRYRHRALHAHEAAIWGSLFKEIDEKGFLVAQAAHLKGYAQTSQDLERYALPGTIALGDWDRFLRYALIAVNLRDVAESLAQSEILEGLARSGQDTLARNLAAQLADAGTRAVARAVLAARLSGEERARAVREVLDDLWALPEAPDDATAKPVATTLLAVARCLGPDLLDDWPSLLEKLRDRPDLRSRVWLAVADGCRPNSCEQDPCFRAALRRIEEPRLLIDSLPAWLADSGAADPGLVREVVREVADPEGTLLWTCLLAALGHQARSTPEAALERWDQQRAAGPPIPWSTALLEAGGALFSRLDPAGAARLARELSDVTLRAAFRVVRLEGQPTSDQAREALQAVRELPGGQQLHWMLRVLAVWPEEKSLERRRLTLAAVAFLSRLRYAAPPADLRRFLDLVADALPGELRHQVESALWSPAGSPELLELLAEQAKSPVLLRQLLAGAESYATVVCPTEAEAFELRSRILVRLGCRLVLTTEGLTSLDEVAARLLPEERDELCAKVARLLYEGRRAEDALHALGEIRSRRIAVTTALAIQANPPGQEGPFDPGALYSAVATVDFAEDERLALLALAQPPVNAESLLDTLLVPIRDRERQAQAVIDLARRTLEFEREFLKQHQRDPLSPRQLVRHALSATGSDERLLALSLDLLDLAEPLDLNLAAVELRETVDVAMLGLEQVSWPARRRALGTLLCHVQPVLLKGAESVARCQAVAELIDSIMALPDRYQNDDLRQHWDEVLVLLIATVERLPFLVRLALEHPLRVRIWGQWLPGIGRLVGWKKSWAGLSWLESQIVPRRLRERLRTPWAQDSDALLARWSWLDEDQKTVVRLCFDSPGQRCARARVLLAESSPCPRSLRSLAHLLSTSAPELVPDLVSRLPVSSERDDVCMELVRGGWLPPEQSQELISRIGDREHQLLCEVLRPAEPASPVERESWRRDLCELISRQGLDPSDPAAWPGLRRLRTIPPAEARAPLAAAFLDALQQGGRRAGEKALRVWLNAHLSPQQDRKEELLASFDRSRDSIQQGVRLTSAAGEEPASGPQSQQKEKSQDRKELSRFYRRWIRAAQTGGKRQLPWLESEWVEKALVFGLSTILLFLDTAFMPHSSPAEPASSRLYPLLGTNWGILLLGFSNALLIEGSFRTRFDPILGSAALRSLRFLLSGVPLLGPYALSLLYGNERWRKALFPESDPQSHPPQILSSSSRLVSFPPVLYLRRLTDWGASRLTSSRGLAVWLTVNAVLVMLWAGRLAAADGGPLRRLVVLIAVSLHLLTFTVLVSILWRQSRRTRAPMAKLVFGVAASCLALVPLPLLPMMGWLLALLIIPETDEKTMPRILQSRRSAARGLPQWLKLEKALLSSWGKAGWRGLWRPDFETAREPVEANWQLLSLYRFKSALLHVEGAGFSWGLLSLADQKVHGTLAFQAIWLLAVTTTSILGATTLLLTAVRFTRRTLRVGSHADSPDHRPGFVFVAASQLAFLSGLCVGFFLLKGEGKALGGVLLITGTVGCATLFPPFLLSLVFPVPPSSERAYLSRTLWCAGFAMIGLAGLGIQDDRLAQTLYLSLYRRLALFSPLLALIPAAVGLRWLLRPFHPGQILEQDRPLRSRAILAFLFLTAVLPLGGLAVPVWIYIRERLWPRLLDEEISRRLTLSAP